jgi:hypothetical protein
MRITQHPFLDRGGMSAPSLGASRYGPSRRRRISNARTTSTTPSISAQILANARLWMLGDIQMLADIH